MSLQLTVGQSITLISDGDRIIDRVLVAVEKDVLFVSKREEVEAAAKEGREPDCIGFRRKYLIDRGGKL